MKKFKKILSVISSVSLLNFHGIVFNNISNAMHSTQSKSGLFSLKHNYTYDELVKLLNSLELFIEKSTSGKSILNLEKETLEVEKEYLMSKGVKEKRLKRLNRATLAELSAEIDMTDPMYLRYFEHIDAGGTGCCRTYAGFVHELLKRFGVESYVISTRNANSQNPHAAVVVKMPLCNSRSPWHVVPCAVASDYKCAKNIIEYLICVSKNSQGISILQIAHKFGGTNVQQMIFPVPLNYTDIPCFSADIIKHLDSITNKLKGTAKK